MAKSTSSTPTPSSSSSRPQSRTTNGTAPAPTLSKTVSVAPSNNNSKTMVTPTTSPTTSTNSGITPFPLSLITVLIWHFTPVLLLSVVVSSVFVPVFWAQVILYAIWWTLSRKCMETPRFCNWLRKCRVWKWYKDYFPVSIVKEGYLSPSENYLFCYHSKTSTSLAAFVNFATEANNISQLFPAMPIYILTRHTNLFQLPLIRELVRGFVYVCPNAVEGLLKKRLGNSVVVPVGNGIEESKESIAAQVKLGMKVGAHLVPVITLNESSLKDILPPVTMLLRAIFPSNLLESVWPYYQVGFLPSAKPLTTVVGKPVLLPKVAFPTEQQVNEFVRKYVVAMEELQSRKTR